MNWLSVVLSVCWNPRWALPCKSLYWAIFPIPLLLCQQQSLSRWSICICWLILWWIGWAAGPVKWQPVAKEKPLHQLLYRPCLGQCPFVLYPFSSHSFSVHWIRIAFEKERRWCKWTKATHLHLPSIPRLRNHFQKAWCIRTWCGDRTFCLSLVIRASAPSFCKLINPVGLFQPLQSGCCPYSGKEMLWNPHQKRTLCFWTSSPTVGWPFLG